VISASRPHLAEWLPWATLADRDSLAAFLAGSLRSWDERRTFNYAIREPGGELAGGTGLHPRLGPHALEIGYWVRADRINRGYATAAARALTEAALALPGVERVEIHYDEANVRSAAVPPKLGYRLDRTEADEIAAPGEVGRSLIWVYPP
jgi:RimJ/RimL family protein N-acetyltransferase